MGRACRIMRPWGCRSIIRERGREGNGRRVEMEVELDVHSVEDCRYDSFMGFCMSDSRVHLSESLLCDEIYYLQQLY